MKSTKKSGKVTKAQTKKDQVAAKDAVAEAFQPLEDLRKRAGASQNEFWGFLEGILKEAGH